MHYYYYSSNLYVWKFRTFAQISNTHSSFDHVGIAYFTLKWRVWKIKVHMLNYYWFLLSVLFKWILCNMTTNFVISQVTTESHQPTISIIITRTLSVATDWLSNADSRSTRRPKQNISKWRTADDVSYIKCTRIQFWGIAARLQSSV